MTATDIDIDIAGKNVLIIGYPASGKTTFLKNLKGTEGHKIFHADDYIELGIQSLFFEIKCSFLPTIVEGVSGYRLLKEGAENGCYVPDLVIELQRDFSKIERTYYKERKEKSLRGVMMMIKGCDTMLREYKNAYYNPSLLEWHKIYIE